MNFDERETHWEQFLQQKAELVKSFCQDTHCKVCLCLELLKIVVCHNNCFSPEEEKHYLISRLLDGILEEETVTIIKQKFEQHFDNISNSIAAQNKLASLEEILDNCNNEIAKIADVNTQENLKKKNLNIEYDEVASTAYMRKIEDLEQRLLQLEGSLTSLTKENADLKEKIHKASLLYESYMKRRKSEIITEYIQIRDEQEKLRSYLSNIKDQVDKNSENLAKLQREALKPEIRAQLECLSKDFQKYRDLFEQQKSAFDTSCYALKQASNRSQEAVKELDQTRGEIQALKERQNDLRKWQKECKELSKHSDNLLSAADSVYSSQQEFKDFQQNIQNKLESLRQEVVALRSPNQLKKTASEIEDYKLEVFGLRKQMDDVKFSSDRSHPGELKLDTALGSKVWSCCKMGQNAVGCQKHTKN